MTIQELIAKLVMPEGWVRHDGECGIVTFTCGDHSVEFHGSECVEIIGPKGEAKPYDLLTHPNPLQSLYMAFTLAGLTEWVPRVPTHEGLWWCGHGANAVQVGVYMGLPESDGSMHMDWPEGYAETPQLMAYTGGFCALPAKGDDWSGPVFPSAHGGEG